MSDKTMSDETTVVRSVTVPVPPADAFAAFTERLGEFKPPEHNLLQVPIAETVVELRAGGGIVDRGVDGSECRWARVVEFDPPERFVFAWDVGPTWQVETDLANSSEVEVRFVADGPTSTTVHLEHRHLDRHGPGWKSVRDGVGSDGGWPLYLRRYAAMVTAASVD